MAAHCSCVGWLAVGEVCGDVRAESVLRVAFLGFRPRLTPVPLAGVPAARAAGFAGRNVFSGAG